MIRTKAAALLFGDVLSEWGTLQRGHVTPSDVDVYIYSYSLHTAFPMFFHLNNC